MRDQDSVRRVGFEHHFHSPSPSGRIEARGLGHFDATLALKVPGLFPLAPVSERHVPRVAVVALAGGVHDLIAVVLVKAVVEDPGVEGLPGLGLKGVLVDEPVLNIDLAPTFIHYAGVSVPAQMQGRSWRPLLERKAPQLTPDWRTTFFYEYFYEHNFPVPTLFAVRTPTAKLIKYKEHDDWTEVFDLARDPYEMKNLNREPAAAKLRTALDAEYDRQKQAAGFILPAYDAETSQPLTRRSAATLPANYPYTSDAIESQPTQPLAAWVLDYRFDKDEGDKVIDASGKGNHGHATNVPFADGGEGRKARRFEGKGCIAVPKSPTLNPAVRSWTVEVVFKADVPDGILVAHGGAALGYCLALEGGKPVFTVVGQKQQTRVAAADQATGAWTTVRANITPEALLLTVNGAAPVREPLKSAIAKEPNDALQIGDDLGSAVLGGSKPPAFRGLIESVRIYDGKAP